MSVQNKSNMPNNEMDYIYNMVLEFKKCINHLEDKMEQFEERVNNKIDKMQEKLQTNFSDFYIELTKLQPLHTEVQAVKSEYEDVKIDYKSIKRVFYGALGVIGTFCGAVIAVLYDVLKKNS